MKNRSLITITEQNGQRSVSARELHLFLENKERFSKWFERMISYGFENQIDYTPYQIVHPNNNQTITDYVLTLDTAKEISMIQRSVKGKQARRYFIEMEKKAKKAKEILVLEINEDAKYLELTSLIRKYLQRGDIKDVADATGFSQKTLGLVLKGMKTKSHFIQALYEKALDNKKSGRIIGVQLMIENLK